MALSDWTPPSKLLSVVPGAIASRGSTFSTLRTMSSQCVIRRHAIGTAREISFGVDKGKG